MISEGQEMFLFGPPLQNLFESISIWFLYNMLTMFVTALFFVTKVQCSTNFILSAFLYLKKIISFTASWIILTWLSNSYLDPSRKP